MKTYASLFTGGGLADWGARAAGLTPVWGVEYDAQIAAVAQQNDPTGTIHHASVCDVDYAALPRVDVLHASPPCPNFSVAKTGGVETEQDRALAAAVCRAIDAQRPTLFTLENVRGYAGSESLTRIQATLLDLDYHVTTVVLNAADYGVPQTRERLFLIAHAGGWMQSQRPLPSKQSWRGWYQAIEDLIPTLPDSAFAPWQLARLPEELRESFLMRGDNANQEITTERQTRPVTDPAPTIRTDAAPRAFILSNSKTEYGDGMRDAGEPMLAVTGQTAGRARAFLVNGDNASRDLTIRDEEEPDVTVSAQRPSKSQARAWLASGRVVAMTPRALGRFQTLPDSYILPDRKSLACRIIGNGVAVDAYAALLRSQLCN